MTLNIGNRPPSFSLPAAGGGHALFEPGDGITLVVFTCNHCPYARAWHERIQKVAQDYTGRVTVLQINSNDASRQPLDSFESMEAREAGGDFSSPYLHDEDQSVAKAWDAMVTPDVFIIDAEGELAYHGAPDGSLRRRLCQRGMDQGRTRRPDRRSPGVGAGHEPQRLRHQMEAGERPHHRKPPVERRGPR